MNHQINSDKHHHHDELQTRARRRWSSLGAKQLKSALSLIYVSTENPEQKKNTSLTPVGQATDKKLRSQPTKMNSNYVAADIESDAKATGVQLKKATLKSFDLYLILPRAYITVTAPRSVIVFVLKQRKRHFCC